MRRFAVWIEGDWRLYQKTGLVFESMEEIGTAGTWCRLCGYSGSRPPIHEWYGELAAERELSSGWLVVQQHLDVGEIVPASDDWFRVQCEALAPLTSDLLGRFPIERSWRADGCARVRPLSLLYNISGGTVPRNLIVLGLASPTLLLHPTSVPYLLPSSTDTAPVYMGNFRVGLVEVIVKADAVLVGEQLCPSCHKINTHSSVGPDSRVLWPKGESIAWLRGTGQLLVAAEFVNKLREAGIVGFRELAKFEVEEVI